MPPQDHLAWVNQFGFAQTGDETCSIRTLGVLTKGLQERASITRSEALRHPGRNFAHRRQALDHWAGQFEVLLPDASPGIEETHRATGTVDICDTRERSA